jgi:fatty acid desaturase
MKPIEQQVSESDYMKTFNRKRHRFSDEIKQAIKKECVLDNWHGPLAILGIYCRIAFSIAFPYVLSHMVSQVKHDCIDNVWWFAYTISMVCIGFWQRALARVVHESAHKVLTKSRRFGKFLGTFASGYLIFQDWNSYHASHIDLHHPCLGDDKYDPDLAYHKSLGLYDDQSKAIFIWKNLIAPLFLLKSPSKIFDLLTNRLFSKEQPIIETLAKFTYIGALWFSSILLGVHSEFFLFWIVPIVVVFPVANWYIELFEHYPLVKQSELDIHMTRNRWSGVVAKFFTGTFNEHLHQVHHLFPSVPFWKLGKVHAILMSDEAYAATQCREVGLIIPVISGIPSIVGGLVSRRAKTH